jgi:alpha-glucosidase
MYRDALALRRKVFHHEDLTWQDAPSGVLAFDRGEGFRCTVNMTAEPLRMDRPGELLIASGPLTMEDGVAILPPDTTVWWSL